MAGYHKSRNRYTHLCLVICLTHATCINMDLTIMFRKSHEVHVSNCLKESLMKHIVLPEVIVSDTINNCGTDILFVWCSASNLKNFLWQGYSFIGDRSIPPTHETAILEPTFHMKYQGPIDFRHHHSPFFQVAVPYVQYTGHISVPAEARLHEVTCNLSLYSIRRHRLIDIRIPIINLRRSLDRLRFIIWVLYIRKTAFLENRSSGINKQSAD